MVAGGGLVLSPAQRSLVEKSFAVQRVRDERESIQKALEEIRKARCDTMQHRQHAMTTTSAKERDHRLIIRHVGEQLASVAKRELLHEPRKCGKKASESHQVVVNGSSTSWPSGNASANDKSARSEVTNGDDEYDEDRFGSVRRPPCIRPPNLWVSIFEKEQAEVKHEQEEAKRCQQELQQTLEQQVAAQKKKAQSELRVLERYKTMMEEEKRQKELKKQQHKQEMALVKQANAMQLELKRKELLREQEEEVMLQKEYAKKLALLNVKSAEEKAREDEERAAIIQAQVRKKEEEELKRRAVRKQEVTRTQVLALVQQKAERRQQHLAEQQAEGAYAKEFKRDFQQWQQKEIDKKLAAHERNRDYQVLVKQQMALDELRKASEDKYGMTREEMALNAALLKKAGVAQVPQDVARTRQY
ncbi:hypothetical protein FI667_g8174, partial [Globisporangium splendens]